MDSHFFRTLLSGSLSLMLTVTSIVPVAQAAVRDWEKGASISPTWAKDFATDSFKQSLKNLADTHANAVSLVIPYYQSTLTSSDLQPGWITPSDESLGIAIDEARKLGMKVTLKIHVEPRDHSWRANIDPSDKAAWFAAYTSVVLHYAQIGEAHHAAALSIGTELIKLTSPSIDPMNTQYWKLLIADVRKVFSGQLTYGANHGGEGIVDEKNLLGFWPDLDYISLSAYHPMPQKDSVTVEEMKQSWDTWEKTQVEPLHFKTGKPVVFGEVGFRSITNAHKDPSNWSVGGCYDGAEQARDYDAMFAYWNTVPWMQGAYVWDWKTKPDAGGVGDTGFTPQGKPAQQVMASWFGSGYGPSPSTYETEGSSSSVCVVGWEGGSSSVLDGSSSLSSGGSSSSVSSGGTSSNSTSSSGGGGGGGGGSSSSSSGGTSGGGGGGGGGGGAGDTGGTGGTGGTPAVTGGTGVPPPAFGGPVVPRFPPAAGEPMASASAWQWLALFLPFAVISWRRSNTV